MKMKKKKTMMSRTISKAETTWSQQITITTIVTLIRQLSPSQREKRGKRTEERRETSLRSSMQTKMPRSST